MTNCGMDAYVLSQVFGASAIGFRAASLYVQSRFPDAHRMRLSVIPTHAVSALSYALANAPIAGIAYAGAAMRSALLSTRFGQKHKNIISAFNVAAIMGATAILYEKPEDALAVCGTVVATIGDYQAQGRYSRLSYFIGRLFLWMPMAYAYENWAMLVADGVAFGLTTKAILEHDIRNAAGKNKPFLKNLKAYLHGIFHDSATGAEIKGQVSTNKGHTDLYVQYADKLRKTSNPFFEDRQKQVSDATASPSAHI